MFRTLAQLIVIVAGTTCLLLPAHAQEKPMLKDVLNLDATVNSQIAPDMAVVALSVEKQGADAAIITNEVNQILAAGLKEAKGTAGVQAATGGFTTYPRYDNKGQRNGWVVHAELITKSKDFGVLGKLAGKLSTSMQIANNGFEVSPELKQAEEEKLIAAGLAAFQSKARAAVKALGYSGYTVREVSLGSAQLGGGPRPQPMQMGRSSMAAQAEGAPMPIEAGLTTLTLTINGSVQMK
jgi:predicted secreted protein